MSTAASTITIIASVVAVGGVQAFWISRSLDELSKRIDRLEARIDDVLQVLREHESVVP